jgi:hypothetical protein
MGLASSQGMVVNDAATILAHRSRTGKRRVHFINALAMPWCMRQNVVGFGMRLPRGAHDAESMHHMAHAMWCTVS